MTKPSVGCIVHYQSHGSPDGTYKSECRPAIVVTAPTAGRGRPTKKLDLFVMTPTGTHHNACLQDEDTKAGGTWHWCERVEEDAPKPVKAAKAKAVEAPATDAGA
jgi:hypothetical protein